MTDAPALHLASVYLRQVNAPLERIWENVFDWAHIAYLHDGGFAAIGACAAQPALKLGSAPQISLIAGRVTWLAGAGA